MNNQDEIGPALGVVGLWLRWRARRGLWSAAVIVAAALVVGVGGAGVVGGCAKKSEGSKAPEGQAGTIHKDLYVVRGEVRGLPDPANPATELTIRHESIAHFRGPGGRLGMNTMTMPFPVAEGVSLEGIGVGDAVEFTFEVDFDTEKDRPSGFRLTEIRRLGEGTALEFTPLPRKDGAGL